MLENIPPRWNSERLIWMSEEEVAQLRREGPWGDGAWTEVDPDSITYGMTWAELSEEFELLGEFLQAAALAGHVDPFVLDGVVAVLRAHQVFVLSDVSDRLDPGVPHQRLVWKVVADRTDPPDLAGVLRWVGVEASRYRRLVVMLEGFINELEQWAAATYRDNDDAKSGELVEHWLTLAAEADLRAKRARVRARLAEADQRAASERREAMREAWLAEQAAREA